MQAQRKSCSSFRVGKGHGGLTLILIFVPSNLITTVCVPFGRLGAQKHTLSSNKPTRTPNNDSVSSTALFQVSESHHGARGAAHFSPKISLALPVRCNLVSDYNF